MQKLLDCLEDLINHLQYSSMMKDSFVRESVERARKTIEEYKTSPGGTGEHMANQENKKDQVLP